MSRKSKFTGMLAVLATTLVSIAGTSAFAATRYDYSVTDPSTRGTGAGIIREFSASYSNVTKPRLQVSFDIQRNFENYGLADGAWLVLSNGDVPGSTEDGLAILYFDFNNRDIYAYRADEPRARDSWRNPDNHIRTYSDVLNVDRSERGFDGIAHRVRVSFDLDISAIQDFSSDPNWTGSEFGEEVGIWFHTLEITNLERSSDGRLTDFVTGREGFLDRTDRPTTPVRVPEPAGLAAIGFGAVMGLALFRRRRMSQAEQRDVVAHTG